MTFEVFCLLVRVFCKLHGLSVTSWGRTVEHNRLKGGLPNSWHLDWMAVDAVPDAVLDQAKLKADAEAFGFDCVLEADHVHLEPRGARSQSGTV